MLQISTVLWALMCVSSIVKEASACPSRTPASKGSPYCAAHGNLTNPKLFAGSSSDNLLVCIDSCFSLPKCKSFSYDVGNGACNFYSANLTAQGFQAGKSTPTYYNRGCYKPCPTTTTSSATTSSTCKPAPAHNIVPNGNFETGGVYPWTSYNSYDTTVSGDIAFYQIQQPGYQSSYLTQLVAIRKAGAQSDSFAELYQDGIYQSDPQSNFRASFMYKVDTAAIGVGTLTFTIFSGGRTYIDEIITLQPPNADSFGTLPGNWATYTNTFSIATSDIITVGLSLSTSGTASFAVYLDNVSLVLQ